MEVHIFMFTFTRGILQNQWEKEQSLLKQLSEETRAWCVKTESK